MNKLVAIVLGGTYPHKSLINNLKLRGYYTILIDYYAFPPAKVDADEHIQESTLDKGKVLEIAKKRNASLVISTCIDHANVTACYVAEELNLPAPYSYEIALTVTNKNMTRFMMSLAHSIDLVLYALTQGKDGEIYIRKAPAATIGDLAEILVEIFNYDKGIQEIGIRPGEKIHETLISSEETVRTEDCGDYYKIIPEVPGMDYRQYYFKGQRNNHLPKDGYTSANTKRLSKDELKELLLLLDEIKKELS